MAVPPLISPDALKALRRDMRKLRQHLANTGLWRQAEITPQLSLLFKARKIIALYTPMSGEPDPAIIQSNAANAAYAKPSLSADDTLAFRAWAQGDPEIPAAWGGTQPGDNAPIVIPDLVFVPLVAFDTALNRLGQGGGHYDRYLASYPAALRVGVAWEGQRIDQLPVQPWDIPLDAVITEQNCYLKEPRPCLIR
jgi:5-formyltetrahydrofolate cyclo-ligase